MTQKKELSNSIAYDVVVEAIASERKKAPTALDVCLSTTKTQKLRQIGIEGIRACLDYLEQIDKALRVEQFWAPKKPGDKAHLHGYLCRTPVFILELDLEFDNWYAKHRYFRTVTLQELSGNNLACLKHTVSEISKLLELHHRSRFEYAVSSKEGPAVLEFLKGKRAINYFRKTEKGYEIFLNVEAFKSFAIQLYDGHKPGAASPQVVKFPYKITMNANNEILLNGHQLVRPGISSANECFMTYILKHPNRTLKRAEIDDYLEAQGHKTNKRLSKFVENLGFKGDLLKVFFKVTKTSVFFRNPVTKSQFKSFKVPPLKFPSK